MKRFWQTLAIATLIWGCIACDGGEIDGYVVGKSYQAETTIVHYDAVLQMNTVQHIPEQWFIYVADSLHVHNCRVTRDTFLAVKHGQRVRLKIDTNGKEKN